MSILLVDKPKGITSFDIIREIQRVYKVVGLKFPKIGHAGTLDPRATGLMILATGEDTKKLHEYTKLPKVYEAEILLGTKTDSGDLDGKILETKEMGDFDIQDATVMEAIKKSLEKMVGTLNLHVPAYSAIKIQGKRLYDLARKGTAPTAEELPVRSMIITEASLLGVFPGPKIVVRFAVSSGTYVRSLAEHFGSLLGFPATLSELRRTSIGDFSVQDAQLLSSLLTTIASDNKGESK